jgi:hypothetical protein
LRGKETNLDLVDLSFVFFFFFFEKVFSRQVSASQGARTIDTQHYSWLVGLSYTPVILPTQEAEIRRIEVQNQPGQIVLETLSQKSP